jgi:hypothetical protein
LEQSKQTEEVSEPAPDLRDLKLRHGCEPCAQAFVKCDPLHANVRGSICRRCFDSKGFFKCVYAYHKPSSNAQCDHCRKSQKLCKQSSLCDDCIETKIVPCIHLTCDRCNQGRRPKPCHWSGVIGRRALLQFHQSAPLFEAIEGEDTREEPPTVTRTYWNTIMDLSD